MRISAVPLVVAMLISPSLLQAAGGNLDLPLKQWDYPGGPRLYSSRTRYAPQRETLILYLAKNSAGQPDQTQTSFDLANVPASLTWLEFEAIDCDNPGELPAVRIQLNDTDLFSGRLLLSRRAWKRVFIPIPAEALHKGENRIRIHNISDPASVKHWFERWVGVSRLRVVWRDLGAAAAPTSPFKDGERVVFVGDSTTQFGLYVSYVALFQQTRYPHLNVTFHNAGMGGNSSNGIAPRFWIDIQSQKPAHVFILIGMNDAAFQDYNENLVKEYLQNIDSLCQRIKSETAATPWLLTPLFYDYERRKRMSKSWLHEGYNAVLARYGQALLAFGREKGIAGIDMNAPAAAVNARQRKKEPGFSLTLNGIHATPTGHLVNAGTILKALKVRPVVSSTVVKVADKTAKTQHAKLSDLEASGERICFTLLEESLPFPRPPQVRVEIYQEFATALNQQTLAVQGLAAGHYALLVDDAVVGTFSAREYAEGIQLGTRERMPQYQQALEILTINDEWTQEMFRLRDIRSLEKSKGHRQADGTYPRPYMKKVKDEKTGKVMRVVNEEREKAFAARVAPEKEILSRLRQYELEMMLRSKPRPHHYRILKAD